MAELLKIVVDKGPAAGAEAVLRGNGIAIGSDPAADLVLHGDQFVTPQHARIVWSADGAVLRNQSPNGTLVNGRSVNEVRLAAGDTISIGLLHLLAVRELPGAVRPSQPSPAAAAAPARPAARREAPRPTRAGADTAPAAKKSGLKLPIWLIAYLVLIGIAAVVLSVMRISGTSQAGLPQIVQQEQEYATGHKYPKTDTDRVIRLLDAAVVHERRGDSRSAYEAYREVLSVRRPVDPKAPSYLYAASRIATLGPK